MIGAGVMGETLLAGLLRAGWEPRPDHRRRPRTRRGWSRSAAKHGIHTGSTADAAARADTVVIVVKPQDAGEVLPEVGAAIRPGTLVVSLCAGLSTARLEADAARGHRRSSG